MGELQIRTHRHTHAHTTQPTEVPGRHAKAEDGDGHVGMQEEKLPRKKQARLQTMGGAEMARIRKKMMSTTEEGMLVIVGRVGGWVGVWVGREGGHEQSHGWGDLGVYRWLHTGPGVPHQPLHYYTTSYHGTGQKHTADDEKKQTRKAYEKSSTSEHVG